MRGFVKFFIKYPIWTNVLKILIIGAGLIAINSIRASLFPEKESQTINISVVYPGASPEEIEQGVIQKIEDNLKSVLGLDRYQSVSQENSGSLTIEVLEGYDTDEVLQDVKNAVERIVSFPVGMEPPVVSKRAVQEMAMVLALSYEGRAGDLKSLKALAKEVENDLRGYEGISQVTLGGYPSEEIAIELDESLMQGYGITFDEVSRAISGANLDLTSGTIKTDREEFLIRLKSKEYYGRLFENITVRSATDGRKVRISDIATVYEGFADSPQRTYLNDTLSVTVSVYKLLGEDILQITDDVRAYVEDYNLREDNVKATIIGDVSESLRERISMLLENGFIGVLLVVISLAIFLNWRLSVWVALSIPFCFAGAFFIAYISGITVNVISLFGAIVVVGIIVDDGIVIAEQIYQNYEKGMKPYEAAIQGTLQVLPSVFYAILTTIVMFMPFFFFETPGPRISDMSFIVIFALAFSFLEVLFILPTHLAHSKALTKDGKSNEFLEKVNNIILAPRDKFFAPMLKWSIRGWNKLIPFAVFVFVIIVTLGGLNGGQIRTTFFPQIDVDNVVFVVEMPSGTRETITEEALNKIERSIFAVAKDIEEEKGYNVLERVLTNVGTAPIDFSFVVNAGGGNIGNIDARLVTGDNRDITALEFASRVKEKTGEIYGAEKVEYGSSSFFGKPISLTFASRNLEELKAVKNEVRAALDADPRLKGIGDNDPQGLREITIELKPNAYLLGLNEAEVARQVRQAFFGDEVQRLQRGDEEVKVWVRYNEENRSSIENLDKLRIRTQQGNSYFLSDIADYNIKRGSVKINHIDGKREITVDAELINPDGEVPKIVADLNETIITPLLARYPSVQTLDSGQQRRFKKFSENAIAFPVALVLMFFIITLSFRSFAQTILVFALLPMGIFGAMWGHVLQGNIVSIMSLYGMIALVGIIVNDSIVLVNQMNANLRGGMGFIAAVEDASISRFRPILLTTLTTVLGLFPLMLESSLQAQFLIPMAISVSYGLVVVSIFVLLFLPTLLVFTNSLRRLRRKLWDWAWHGKTYNGLPTREEVEPAVKEVKYIEENLGKDEVDTLMSN
ncbi:MAG: efflux RND transporter permease subunit [Candidatus Kapaibacteriales bacterium]